MQADGADAPVIGFYGFKGGVGRTLAAAHLADLYSRLGYRVLLVDADLEAPGLSFWNDARPGETEEGLVQLLNRLGEADEGQIGPDTTAAYIRSSDDFFAEYAEERRQLAVDRLGDVHLMPAGLGESPQALGTYLADLPRAENEVLRTADRLRVALARSGYDIVLVDSRPGLHQIGATLFAKLSDYNVALFGPSRQAMRGLRTTLGLFTSDLLPKTVFALSPVAWFAADKIDEAHDVVRRFADRNAVDSLRIVPVSWHPALALDEQLITVIDPQSATARDYRRLLLELETVRGHGIDEYTKAVDALLDIFKASVAVDEPDKGLSHLRSVFDQEVGDAFESNPGAVDAVRRYLEQMNDDDPWRRREYFVELLIWEVIRRLRSLARLDRDAAEALWAIVIRRNAPDPDGPRDPQDHVSLKPMERRYEELYERYDGAPRKTLPALLGWLHSEYRKEFGQNLRDHKHQPVRKGQPSYAASIEAFADEIEWLA